MSNTDLKAATLKLGNGQGFIVKGDRVLVECEPDTDTYGHTKIVKHSDYKKYSRWGWIRQSGGVFKGLAKVTVSFGDKVCYEAYAGQDIELNGRDYKTLSPNDLICKIEGDNLCVIGKRTILKPIVNQEVRTNTGIIIADTVQDKFSDIAEVVDSDLFEIGTKVLINPYGYLQLSFNEKTYFVVNTEDILGVISEQ